MHGNICSGEMHAFKTKLATQCSVRMRLCRKYIYFLEIGAKEEILVLFANFGTRCHLNMHWTMKLSNKNTVMLVFFCVLQDACFPKNWKGRRKVVCIFLGFCQVTKNNTSSNITNILQSHCTP